jgi:hypothetical protein
MEWNGPNYTRSRVHSRKLVQTIRDYYENSPLYSKLFKERLDVWVEKDTVTGEFYVRSNLDLLLSNVLDIEEAY